MINLSKFFKVKDLEFFVYDSPIFVQKYVYQISESDEYLWVTFKSDKELKIYDFFTDKKDKDVLISVRPFYCKRFKVESINMITFCFSFKKDSISFVVRLKKLKQ